MSIPRNPREATGPNHGDVEIDADGDTARTEPFPAEGLSEKDGRFVIPASGVVVDDRLVRELRDANQR